MGQLVAKARQAVAQDGHQIPLLTLWRNLHWLVVVNFYAFQTLIDHGLDGVEGSSFACSLLGGQVPTSKAIVANQPLVDGVAQHACQHWLFLS